jgi:hypothetical protein
MVASLSLVPNHSDRVHISSLMSLIHCQLPRGSGIRQICVQLYFFTSLLRTFYWRIKARAHTTFTLQLSFTTLFIYAIYLYLTTGHLSKGYFCHGVHTAVFQLPFLKG